MGDSYQRALDAIRDLHSDTSVPLQTTHDKLVQLQQELNELVEATAADLENEHG